MFDSFLTSSSFCTKSVKMSEALDANIAMWKMKQLVKSLHSARGAGEFSLTSPRDSRILTEALRWDVGTSMISLIIPPRVQISQITNMLTQEYGTGQSRVSFLVLIIPPSPHASPRRTAS